MILLEPKPSGYKTLIAVGLLSLVIGALMFVLSDTLFGESELTAYAMFFGISLFAFGLIVAIFGAIQGFVGAIKYALKRMHQWHRPPPP